MTSFNMTVRQMTEMFHWPKCLTKNDWNVSMKNNRLQGTWCQQAPHWWYLFY